MVNSGIAYLLWLAGCFGLSGVHRLYLGKHISGLIYLFTFGVFGVGQLLDLLFIPTMVQEKNDRYRALHGAPYAATPPPVIVNVSDGYQVSSSVPLTSTTPEERLEVQILRVCRDMGGATVSDCVIETGETASEIKSLIHHLCLEGVLTVDNRESDGAVIYRAI